MTFIYCIYNSSDVPIYIGKSIDPKKRWYKHKPTIRDANPGCYYKILDEYDETKVNLEEKYIKIYSLKYDMINTTYKYTENDKIMTRSKYMLGDSNSMFYIYPRINVAIENFKMTLPVGEVFTSDTKNLYRYTKNHRVTGITSLLFDKEILVSLDAQVKLTKMLRKSVLVMDDNLSCIENFCISLQDEDKSKITIKNYKGVLLKLERELDDDISKLVLDEQMIYRHVYGYPTQEQSKQAALFIVLKFLDWRYPDRQETFLRQKLSMEERQKIPSGPKPIKNKGLTLMALRSKFAQIRDSIGNKEHELLLSILINYDVILRRDYANIKLQDYSSDEPRVDGDQIIFPTVNKVKIDRQIVITMMPGDVALLEEIKNTGQEYLLTITAKDRCNAYTVLVGKIFTQYLEMKMTSTELRHIHSIHVNAGLTTEQLQKVTAGAANRAHSLSTSLKYYNC